MTVPIANVKSPRQTIPVLGVPIAQVTYVDMLALMLAWAETTTRETHTVVAANVHVVTEAALDASYRQAVMDADRIVPDGMPLVWATRRLGGTLRDRCYGPTLMARALEDYQQHNMRHYFYGGVDAVREALVAAVAARWPRARVAGSRSPAFGPFEDDAEHANIRAINAVNPDIVWVGMGCPKQELWMQRYRQRVRAATLVGVGAAFDFIAGTVPQAPAWMQRRGLEWAFRLAAEPRRLWKRYLFRNPYFAVQFLLQYTGLRWRNTEGDA